ncbi:MAG TPA: beta-ketoacyl synthase N-terminal-like domain-containing protein, partial [Spirochaetota bacterium]|nr:beta-ketoacyl synthase N-terminal-like domain-containing protein [Spirochaetota bacterium]
KIPGGSGERESDLEGYFYRILFSTVTRAIESAGLSADEVRGSALFFGSTSIDMPMFEMTYKMRENKNGKILSHESPGYGKIAGIVAEKFGITGPCYTFTTACTSSANCLLYATSMIQAGRIERAIVVGYDLFNEVGFYGFESMKLIEPFTYKPFDKNRIGIIMGEGCGAVVLDRKSRTGREFRFLGGSNACDTFNVTTHNIEGDDIAYTILDALKSCGLTVRDVDAIKAHATGSPANDVTEFNGMKKAFGDSLPPFSGIKPYIGHTVGASGVIELVIIIESIARGFFPATPGFEEADDEIGARPLTEPLPMTGGTVMLNFFGFGGNCTSYIVTNKD